jgi:hypothetical protein
MEPISAERGSQFHRAIAEWFLSMKLEDLQPDATVRGILPVARHGLLFLHRSKPSTRRPRLWPLREPYWCRLNGCSEKITGFLN